MKKIISTLLLFVCFSGYGQDNDGAMGGVDSFTYEPVKYDTIRVLQLLCDTLIGYTPAIIDLNTTSSKQHVHEVYWQYGYVVKEFIPEHFETGDIYVYSHWETKEYLDADKKPLKKSTIVWLTKEIK